MSGRNIICTVLLLTIAFSTLAQTKVTDGTGEPLMGAVVKNSAGTPIGIVDKNGQMPEVSSYPVTIHCLGFEDYVLEVPMEQIVLKEKSYELKEFSVKPGDRPACRVICFIRETSGLSKGSDTVRLSTHYMADYMFKIYDKAKKAPTWDKPRFLNTTVVDFFSNNDKFDQDTRQVMNWSKFFGELSYKVSLPESFHGQNSYSETVKSEKTGEVKRLYHLTPEQYSVRYDFLADYQDHIYSPGFLKMFGITTDFLDFVESFRFSYNPEERYDVTNLTAKTLSFKALGRGKMYQKAFLDTQSKAPVEIYTYIEIYPVAIEYLTVEEAKQIQKAKDLTYPMTLPSDL